VWGFWPKFTKRKPAPKARSEDDELIAIGEQMLEAEPFYSQYIATPPGRKLLCKVFTKHDN
jgi:hypothetical protein